MHLTIQSEICCIKEIAVTRRQRQFHIVVLLVSLVYLTRGGSKKNGILFLELHINPSNVHHNPDGEKILGSHWHIYSEEHGRSWAFSAMDFKDDNFVERFNVIKRRPDIHYQLELI